MKITLIHDEIIKLLTQQIYQNAPDFGNIKEKDCCFKMDGDEIDPQVEFEFVWTDPKKTGKED